MTAQKQQLRIPKSRAVRRSLPWVATACTVIGTTIAVVQYASSTSQTPQTETSTANVVVQSTYVFDVERWRSGLLGDKEVRCNSNVTIVVCNSSGHTSGDVAVRISVPDDCRIAGFAADPLFAIVENDGRRRALNGRFLKLSGQRQQLCFAIPSLPEGMQLAIGISLEQALARTEPATIFVQIHDDRRELSRYTAKYSNN
jgi:hypothetical protein